MYGILLTGGVLESVAKHGKFEPRAQPALWQPTASAAAMPARTVWGRFHCLGLGVSGLGFRGIWGLRLSEC